MTQKIDRTVNERFRRFKDKTGLSFVALADMFGVDSSTTADWYTRRTHIPIDCQRTLFRFEAENIDSLAKLNPETVKAFHAGRKRAQS
jgi:hypothetical protein